MQVLFKRILIGLTVCSVFLFVLFMITHDIRQHHAYMQAHVVDNRAIKQGFIDTDSSVLHYRYAGQAKQAVLVWIHGTPGGWSDIGRLFLNKPFLQNIKLVSIDRPGWGLSQDNNGATLHPQFVRQNLPIAKLLRLLKQQHPDQPLILAGHSWGGSLLPFLAEKNNAHVDGMLILAAGLSADLTQPRWYNKLADLSVIKQILPEALNKANIEVYSLAPQLAAFDSSWTSLDGLPTIVVHGDKDKLVDPRNLDFARKKLNAASSHFLLLKDQGHLLQFERVDLIAQCIKALAIKKFVVCRDDR